MTSHYNAEIDDGKELYPAFLTDAEIPPDSITRLIHGEERHLLTLDKAEGVYHAAIIPEAKADVVTPADLYDSLEDTHSYKLFCNKEHPAKKGFTIALFVIIGFMIFLLFIMWAASLDSGEPTNLMGALLWPYCIG